MATVLRGARIVDGSGGPLREGHLLIEGDGIAAELSLGEPLSEVEHTVAVDGKVAACSLAAARFHLRRRAEGCFEGAL